MTAPWLLQNLLAWSLHAAALAAVSGLCLVVLRVRAPQVRLRALEACLSMALFLTPMAHFMESRREPPRVTLVRTSEFSETLVATPAL